MRKLIFVIIVFTGSMIINSCQKKFLCPDCEVNKPPIAIAGPDQIIVLPKDSTVLDGSNSSDADGKIVSYKWTIISGSSIPTIIKSDSVKTAVKGLLVGVYRFELKVTDDKGASAKDTIQIDVDVGAISNHAPVACAGADQVITLTNNTVLLDGSCSKDLDNNITNYVWTNISGPPSFFILNPFAVQTQVTNLLQGVYLFELKVTDVGGLFSKDTVQVTVNATGMVYTCSDTNRAKITGRLIPVGTLSQARNGMAVAMAGNKILFAGGKSVNNSMYSSRVDIYDITSQTWSTTELSLARSSIASVALGTKIFFAGGDTSNDINGIYTTNRVDIYDVSTNTWTTSALSLAGHSITAAAVGNKVFFAGGDGGLTGGWGVVAE